MIEAVSPHFAKPMLPAGAVGLRVLSLFDGINVLSLFDGMIL